MVFPAYYGRMSIRACVCLLAVLFGPLATFPQEREILFREDFMGLENWKPVYFPKIEKHTAYTTQSHQGNTFLRAQSQASASALVFKQSFNVYDYSRVTWRWKTETVYKKGNAKSKSGDDYPIRVYIVFAFDPQAVGFLERIKYKAAKLLYGEYPPHSSLNYIWANREYAERVITSTYTERSKMIPLQMGGTRLGTWQTEDVHIVDDYRKAFRTDPPPIASIAIMNDSDNTGEHSVSYIDSIEVYRLHSTE